MLGNWINGIHLCISVSLSLSLCVCHRFYRSQKKKHITDRNSKALGLVSKLNMCFAFEVSLLTIYRSNNGPFAERMDWWRRRRRRQRFWWWCCSCCRLNCNYNEASHEEKMSHIHSHSHTHSTLRNTMEYGTHSAHWSHFVWTHTLTQYHNNNNKGK